MLPEIKARYYAKAIGCYFGRAGADGTGNVQVFVPFEITEGEHIGERITWAGTFGDGKSRGFTLDGLKNLGWYGDDLSELEDLDEAGAAHLLPSIVELSCDVDTYNDEVKLKVNWVNKPGGQRMTKHALGGADLKAFAAQMRGTIRGMGGGTRAAPAARPAQRPTAPTQRAASGGGYGSAPAAGGPDEDIPFASSCMSDEPVSISRVLRRSV